MNEHKIKESIQNTNKDYASNKICFSTPISPKTNTKATKMFIRHKISVSTYLKD